MSAAPGASPSQKAAAPNPVLLVVHLSPGGRADERIALHRVEQPCRALGELPEVSVVSGSTISGVLYETGLLLAADLLVLRDVADPDLLPILANRRRQGRLTAYELGGLPFVGVTNGRPTAGGGGKRAPDLVRRSLGPLLARQSDCLQLAAPGVAERVATLNPRRALFPSQLWNAPPPGPVRRVDQVVIGWGGTGSEREDLRAAIPALAGVLERHPEVKLAIQGDSEVQAVLRPLPPDRVTFARWESLDGYLRFLDGIDIGIAPLVPTPPNRALDDARFLEYASRGVLAVCVDLEPYKDVVRPGQTGYLYRDVSELETVLERALAEGEVRAGIVARAARYAARERLERPHARDRLGFYLSTAAQLGARLGVDAPDGRDRGAFPPPELLEPRLAARTFEGSRYVSLGGGEVERLLADGLDQARAAATAEAKRSFLAAARLAPKSHLPPLLLAEVEAPAAAVESLTRAEALNPWSCQAAFRRGLRLLELGDLTDAALAFERARAIAPAFGAPQERLAALAEGADRLEEAVALYEEAALQNGAFALPIAQLAVVAEREGKIDKAVGLLERSLADDPELGLTNFLVGRMYLEQKRFHQARLHLRRAITAGADAAPPEQAVGWGPGQGPSYDRAAVLTALARAEAGLGNTDAARATLEEARGEENGPVG